MILLEGKTIAQKILDELKQEVVSFGKHTQLAIVVVGKDNLVVNKFIEKKKQAAEYIGVNVRIYPFPEEITTNELRKRLAEIVRQERNTAVVIQLPLPKHINTQYILDAVIPEKDVDMLSSRSLGQLVVGKSVIIPPVVASVIMLLEFYNIEYRNQHIVLGGWGRLVGRPLGIYLLNEGATLNILQKDAKNPKEILQSGDIIISGIGKPKYITGEMVKEGVIVIDAGTSESEGKIVGDVDFESVAPKSSYITPPQYGGVGPLTVAMLLKNLLILAKAQ